MKSIHFVFLLVFILSLSSIHTTAQEDQIRKLSVGVKAGDAFSFNVSSNSGQPNLYLLLLPSDVNADFNVSMPSSFSILITDVVQNQSGEFCWIEGDFGDPCVYYSPKIEISFQSDEYSGNSSINLHIGGGIITTNDWDIVDSSLALQKKLAEVDVNNQATYSMEEEGDFIIIKIDYEFTNLNSSIFEFSSTKSSTVKIYDRITGVLQEEKTSGEYGYPNGAIDSYDFQILKTDYTPSVSDQSLALNGFEFSMMLLVLPVVLYRRHKIIN